MQKGLGISALIIAIIAMFIPFIGTWLTILVAIMAAFAYGEGLGLGISSIVVSIFHILFLSPLLWTTQVAGEIVSAHSGKHIYFLPWILIAFQVAALVILFVLHNKSKIFVSKSTAFGVVDSLDKSSLEIETHGYVNNSEYISNEFVPDDFDRVKWNALLKYDKDIALIADRVKPLGKKWLDELASSYLALNDKQYLSEIENKIVSAAKIEAEAREQEAIAAAKAAAEEKERSRIIYEEIKHEKEEQQKIDLQEKEIRSQAWKELFNLSEVSIKSFAIKGLFIFLLIISAVIANELWKKNIKLKEDELRLTEERVQADEIHRKLEDEQVKGLEKIAEMEKHLAEENVQINEARRRIEHEQTRASINPVQTTSSISVPFPAIQVGDSYVYEYVDADNPESSFKTKRTVISNVDKVVFSVENLGAINAKKRNLYFNHEWNLLSTRNADNTGFDYSPPLKYFDFPLYPGKTWQQTTTETNIKTGATRTHKISGTVGQWEDITVAAGVFHAIKIFLQTDLIDPSTSDTINGTDTSWYAPGIHRTVKSITTGKNGKKEIIQLISYDVSKSGENKIGLNEATKQQQAPAGRLIGYDQDWGNGILGFLSFDE